MNTTTKYLILGTTMMIASLANANNPGTDDLDNLNEVIPAIEKTIKNINKVDAKEVEHMFMKKKRIDKIFSPKKKLSKTKYTIA